MFDLCLPLEKHDYIFEAMALPAFIIRTDADKVLRYEGFNPALAAAIGVESADIEGKTPHEFLPARTADTVLANYRKCLEENKPHAYEELLNLNGREHWWETTLSPLRDHDGVVTGILGIAVDITARKAKEFEAVNAYTALQKLNEEIALFTSMTAHDVRGPLGKINLLAEATLEDFEDMGDSKLQMVEMTQAISQQALDYVDGILTYANALQTKPAAPDSFDIAHLCRDISALVDPEARLDIATPKVTVECESVVLQMIIRNLMENASRHAKAQIAILVSEDPQAGGSLRFTVADDGAGFQGGADDFNQRIATRKASPDNRGFGLAAVAHLVEARHGKLWLDETHCLGGTAICFTLPGRLGS